MPSYSHLNKRLIAKELAFGWKKTQIAKVHGLAYDNLLGWIKRDEELKIMIEEERDKLLTRFDAAGMAMADSVKLAADNIIAIANDPDHKDAYRANVYLLEQFVGREKGPAIEVNVNENVLNVLATGMEELSKLRSGAIFQSPKSAEILTGTRALPVPGSLDEDEPARDPIPEALLVDDDPGPSRH